MVPTTPYGTWTSPLSAADTVAGVVGFAEIAFQGESLYWVELRPSEGGRQVLVRRNPDGSIEDLTPPPFNVRTRVHEYGGGAFALGSGKVVFSNFADQRLCLLADGSIRPLTSEPTRPAAVRFADGRFVSENSLVCVRETHPEVGEALNELVLVDLGTGIQTVIASGRDFYSNPRPSEDGRLAWLEWDHPNMPWDGTDLCVASLSGNALTDRRHIAGGPDESVFQPEWAPDGTLVFAADGSGWWNLMRWDGSDLRSIFPMEADFGGPLWQFGRTSFGFLGEGRILAGYWSGGVHHLVVIGPDGSYRVLEDEYTDHGRVVTDGVFRAWFVGVGPTVPTAIVQLDTNTTERVVVKSNPKPVEEGYVPETRPFTFPTRDGDTAHAVLYLPRNPGFVAPEGELPPLIVEVHGGPTSHVVPRLTPSFIYWTSRGFAVVEVNHRGSTGYGRRYRNRLRHAWGVIDVEDCADAALHCAHIGVVDGDRMVITGGSAGGFTTLAALAFDDTFSAGASYFGVADLELLAAHTHKFESRYLDGLVGNDPGVMKERSPLYSVDRIDVPVILFQGLKDRVVPPEQAEMIAAALEANGIPHAHVTYPEEDHGFRKAENLVHSLESELSFYGRVFGFVPAGDVADVPLVGG